MAETESAEPNQEEIVESLYRYAAERMGEGDSDEEVERKLREQGLDAGAASAIVGNLAEARYQATVSAGRKNMLIGAIVCIVGIVVTVGSYSAATGGGSYVVAWGAVLFGAVQFFRGLTQSAGGG
ncbi:MAG: hypothetical protein WD069_16905 [Planctomycetales bacterium]